MPVGIQGDDSLLYRVPIKAALFILDPRVCKDDGPPPVMPDPDRASRAKIPYFGGVSRVGKAEYVYPGSSLSQG